MTLQNATTSALLIDRYELTMLAAARRSGVADKRATFEVFTRSLPMERHYGVFAGLGRLVEQLQNFRFTSEQISFLETENVVDAETIAWLQDFRFTGNLIAYREGELFFANSPVITVEGTFGEAVLLETLILSIVNYDCAIASAGTRMVSSAQDKPLIDMGSRRAHEQAAVAAARAAYLIGFSATSNLEAGKLYSIPTVGTAAHAFTLAHASEREAFQTQVAQYGPETTLLVDTYDVLEGVKTAVDVAGSKLGAVRLDSGDLSSQAFQVRELLDDLGAENTRIVATSDLDEYAISRMIDSPIDVYGVGTRLVGGSGYPTLGFVYKLVEIEDDAGNMVSVEKRSENKSTVGGRKYAYRLLDDETGYAYTEQLDFIENAKIDLPKRALQHDVILEGEFVNVPDLKQDRKFHKAILTELDPSLLALGLAGATIATRYGMRKALVEAE